MARIKIQDIATEMELNIKEMRAIIGGGTTFQGRIVNSLSSIDQQNMDLLSQVINAANEVSSMNDVSNVTFDSNSFTRKSLPDA